MATRRNAGQIDERANAFTELLLEGDWPSPRL